MKKVLLASSALALVGSFASPAAAAEWNMRVGGYMNQAVGFADVDANFSGEFDGVDVYSDTEIHFVPSITLDNGIQFGANIQLEAGGYLSTSDTIDEQYMFIKGSFGEVLLGSENSAGYKMSYGAPTVTSMVVNSGSLQIFIPFSGGGAASGVFRGVMGTTFLENSRNNDAQRFTYFTPRMAGFQLGASYARDGNQDTFAQLDSDSTLSDIFDVGANYVNSFGEVSVALSGRYGTASAPSGPDPDIWAVGLNVGFSGFTIGGSYAEQNDAGVLDGEAWDVGVTYKTGPWGFGLTYFKGKSVGDPDGTGVFAFSTSTGKGVEGKTPESGNETLEQYLVGISYDLGTGVSLGGFFGYVDFDDASAGEQDDSIDGWVLGTEFNISF